MSDLEKRLRSYEPLWGGWTVGRRLYSGGGSGVFALERRRLDKELRCAVKVIEAGADGEPEKGLARAVDEIERMEMLAASPYIVRFLDDEVRTVKDEDGGLRGYDVMIRMEYLSCLADLVRDGERLPEAEIRRLGQEICRALSFAHSRGIVHRDIKPANLYRNMAGCYQLGDFGVSGHAGAGAGDVMATIAGTTAYMAPEVARGDLYDKSADIYSLGVVLYQFLNDNFLPFTGEDSTYSQRESAIRRRQQGNALPPPRRGDKALQEAVLKACHPEPEKRFRSPEEFEQALNPIQEKKGLRPLIAGLLCGAFLLCGLLLSPLLFSGGEGEAEVPGTDFFADGSDQTEEVIIGQYEVVKQNLTWEDAKVYCESRGGHLATVTSRKEEAAVLALLDQAEVTAAWIGADNRNSSKGFQWVTGERFAYAAWGTNEPNNAGGIEYYLMLMYKEDQGWVWNDSKDQGLDLFEMEKVGFVCEWDEEE